MQLQICGECMILIINHPKKKNLDIGIKNAWHIQPIVIAKFIVINIRSFLGILTLDFYT